MKRVVVIAVSALVMAGSVAGCRDAGSTSSPTPTASITPSSAASSTPTPTAQPVTFAEAKATQQLLLDRGFELAKLGGLKPDEKLPPEIAEHLEGSALAETTQDLHTIWKKGGRATGGKPVLSHVVEIDDTSVPGAQIALRSCEDWRQVTSTWADGHKGQGLLRSTTTWYRRGDDGKVKQIEYKSTEVTTCPAQ
ncbi:hypothetical protein [Acidipropionibacterium timonense]|uniref:hypothetical protein n=1 Tax=Acidipropionibacterium timonense TaxID=2161818 RepID=UPI00102F6660|nr:hypothetical protein [Acidipropionibacterium timonense]